MYFEYCSSHFAEKSFLHFSHTLLNFGCDIVTCLVKQKKYWNKVI